MPGPAAISDPSSAAGPGAVDASTYLHPQTLARLGSIELRAKHIVEGVTSGMHRSRHFGFSVEFAQHRPYSPGDDLRHLDWKVFGRSDKLHLKQYEQETNLDLVLLVDASGSMNFGTRNYADASGTGQRQSHRGHARWTKYDHATATAAAIAYMAIRQGDRVGLGMFADALVDAIDRSSQKGQWRKVVRSLATHTVERPTDFPRVIDQTLGKLNTRCLVTIISDFFADPHQIRAALARLRHRRHDVILVQIMDTAEATFALDESAPFEGLEGEGRLRVDPRALRKGYLEALERHNTTLDRLVRGFGFDLARTTTNEWLGPTLAAFMARRNGALKLGGR
ncbi:MAG: DUF58 domain-containing protein [Planctomycetota bacterium]